MRPNLQCIMLIDDDADDNFFHEREIKKCRPQCIVITMPSAADALTYLKSKSIPHPDLIFLDINMPKMNGWEFLEQYNELGENLQSTAIMIMLTTSGNPNDKERSRNWSFISDFITKPLTRGILKEIIHKYFNDPIPLETL